MRTTTRLAAVRAAAAAGALAVGLAGLGLGVSASAVDNLANIDDNQELTLTIHKHVKPTPNTVIGHADGTVPQAASAPVKGVEFTAYPIDLDLNAQASWETLAKAANASIPVSVCDAPNVGTGLPEKLALKVGESHKFDATDAAGVATKTLERGAYLVCETNTAGAQVAGADVQVIDKALPFIVTLPYPDNNVRQNGKNEWIYKVHSFPKNTVVNKPVKKVKVADSSHGLGTEGQVTYTIDAVVPRVEGNTENFKYFTIYDQLPVGSSDITVTKVELGDSVATNGTLEGVEDYPKDKYSTTIDEGARYVQVDFNQIAHLTHLESIPGKTIRVTITAKQAELPANGKAENIGNLLVDTETSPHDPGNPPTTDTPPVTPGQPPLKPPTGDTPPVPTGDVPPLPTNKVASTWGEVKVTKTDAANQKPLKDAVFSVYEADQPYAEECSGVAKVGAPISVNGKTTFTADGDGIVTIAGLFVDSAEGVGNADPDLQHAQRCYVLVETAAPAGYVLPDGADAETKIAVKPSNAAATVNANQNHFSITNTKTAVPALPLTGASGQVLMMAGGAALVLLSAGTVLVARRREAQD